MNELAAPNGAQVAVRDEPALLAPFDPADLGLPRNLTEQMQFAELVAGSDLVPKALQGKTANCFLVIQKAIALRLPWDVAMSGIHVIENKVTCGAKLLRMLMRRAGHDFFPHSVTDKEAQATLTLAQRPDRPIEVGYTIAEAQTAGLTGKAVWKNYGKSMLVAAASRRAVDWYCPEVAMGLDLSDDTLAAALGLNPEQSSGPVRATSEVIDLDDQASTQRAGGQDGEDPARARAAEVLRQAREADDVGVLTKLGKQARQDALLDLVVDDEGTTLKDALMNRMREVEGDQGARA